MSEKNITVLHIVNIYAKFKKNVATRSLNLT